MTIELRSGSSATRNRIWSCLKTAQRCGGWEPTTSVVTDATSRSVFRAGCCGSMTSKAASHNGKLRVPGPIRHVAFHPSRPQLAVAAEQNLQIRQVDDGRLLIQIDQAARTEFLTWHPRGKFLATSDWEGTISLREPDLLRRQAVLSGHSMGGVTTAFNHSGSLLFSTAWDGSLRVWEPHWGKLLFATIGSPTYHLRFSGDDHLWTGDVADDKIRIWELAESPAYRRLTPEATFELGHFRTALVSPGVAAGPARRRDGTRSRLLGPAFGAAGRTRAAERGDRHCL